VDQRQHFPNKSNQIGGEVGEEKNQAETMNPMGAVTGRRSMSTISKAVAEITGVGKTKTRKATSELCTFMGIPHHSRSEIATIISKFIKLHSARVPILPFFIIITHQLFDQCPHSQNMPIYYYFYYTYYIHVAYKLELRVCLEFGLTYFLSKHL
jgi:hypothetical protein